jgi:hypothetical protein
MCVCVCWERGCCEVSTQVVTLAAAKPSVHIRGDTGMHMHGPSCTATCLSHTLHRHGGIGGPRRNAHVQRHGRLGVQHHGHQVVKRVVRLHCDGGAVGEGRSRGSEQTHRHPAVLCRQDDVHGHLGPTLAVQRVCKGARVVGWGVGGGWVGGGDSSKAGCPHWWC